MSIRILHLYSKLLDLYGDFFNIKIIEQKIREMGLICEIENKELGDSIDFSRYDMVYIGHGKGKNLEALSEHFYSYRQDILDALENDTVFLATGNSRLLFGKSFEGWSGETKQGIGLFDYTAVETRNVFTSDVVSKPVFDESLLCYGFINRTAHILGNDKYPLFHTVLGAGDNQEKTGTEGNLYKNFFGTWQMGPILARNPALLKEVLKRLLKQQYKEFDSGLEEQALELTLKEFEKRL